MSPWCDDATSKQHNESVKVRCIASLRKVSSWNGQQTADGVSSQFANKKKTLAVLLLGGGEYSPFENIATKNRFLFSSSFVRPIRYFKKNKKREKMMMRLLLPLPPPASVLVVLVVLLVSSLALLFESAHGYTSLLTTRTTTRTTTLKCFVPSCPTRTSTTTTTTSTTTQLFAATTLLEGRKIKGDVKPLNNFLLVRKADAQEQTQGGILLTGKAKIVKTEGTVVAVGPGKTHPDSGLLMEMPINVGDGVVYGK